MSSSYFRFASLRLWTNETFCLNVTASETQLLYQVVSQTVSLVCVP